MNLHFKIQDIKDVGAVIRDMLGDDFDDQTFLDTLDGETNAMDLVGYLILSKVEADAQEAAMKDVAAAYAARAKRFTAQSDAIRKGLGQLLDATGEAKIAHPMGTVSRTKPRLSMVIVDDRSIPSQLCKAVPDNAAIKAQLEAGEIVPGAELRAGEPGVTIRVK